MCLNSLLVSVEIVIFKDNDETKQTRRKKALNPTVCVLSLIWPLYWNITESSLEIQC